MSTKILQARQMAVSCNFHRIGGYDMSTASVGDKFLQLTDKAWFERYKFLQPIGQGGMGQVFLAEDRQCNNEPRVIKQLLHKSSGDEFERNESVRLFKREAAILRSLDHHGIVHVHDYHVSEDGKYFLVMDYVPGKNLEMIINTNGPLSSELVVRIGIHCCEVLEYLHTLRDPIIYRDLKPSNIMLTPDGQIIFVDFGIARQFMPKEVATRVVTAGYSPPEQYFGKPETRSDIYSLGATMHHLLTGVRPKPLSACNPASANINVMPSLNSLICKMTAHDLDDRPPSATAVKHALYRVYKELHPEFEMPDGEDGYEESVQYAPQPAYAGGGRRANMNEVAASYGGGMRSASNPYSATQTEPERGPSIFEKVMRWFESLRS